MNPGKIQFAESEGVYVLKLIGEVRLTLCSNLENFLQIMLEEPDFRSVIVDLSDAQTIDSTSLGLLAKLSIMARRQVNQRPVLISPRPDITRILMSMGFEHIFVIAEEAGSPGSEFREIECEQACEDTTHAQVLDAHRVLMSLSENNARAFSDLVKQLERCRQHGVAHR